MPSKPLIVNLHLLHSRSLSLSPIPCELGTEYVHHMIPAGLRSQPYGLPFECMIYPQMGWEASLTPTLYNSVKLCKSTRYMECKRNNGTAKREEVVDVFRKGKFELLALIEAKLKGNGEVSWCGVSGIIAGVQEMERAREGVAIMFERCVAQCGDRLWMC